LITALIIQTFLFNAYINQRHFRVAEHLPSKACIKADLQNGGNFDLNFVKGAYLQEELREKEAFPQDLPEERAVALGLAPTPPMDEEGGDMRDANKSKENVRAESGANGEEQEKNGWAFLRKRFIS
jgi:hypothetical protein